MFQLLFALFESQDITIAAKGRGIGRLFRAAMEGEIWAIAVLSVIALIVIGVLIYKFKNRD